MFGNVRLLFALFFYGLKKYIPIENLEYFVLIGVILIISVCVCSGVCSCYFTSIIILRLKEYGSLYGNGLRMNMFIQYIVEPPKKVLDERRNLVIGEDYIDEIMEISRLSHPQYLREDYDVIIIGSGISSLTAAGFLSRAGKKCLILEEDEKFGGSYIGNMVLGDDLLTEWVFDALSGKNITLESIDDRRQQHEIFDFQGRNVIELKRTSNLTRLEQELKRLFPHEESSISKFFHYANDCEKSYDTFYTCRHYPPVISYFYRSVMGWEENIHHYGQYSVEDILDFCEIKDKMLRAIIESSQTLVSSQSPEDFIFPLCVKMLEAGWKKSMIVGGYDEIPRHIISRLKTGSRAVHHVKVKRILCRPNGTGYGVELESGEQIMGSDILSSVGVKNTYHLLPKHARNMTRDFLREEVFEEYKPSGFFFYVHFEISGATSTEAGEGIGHDHSQATFFALPDLGKVQKKMKKLWPPNFQGFEDCYYMKMISECYNSENNDDDEESEEDDDVITKVTLSTFCYHEWFVQMKEEENNEEEDEEKELDYFDTDSDSDDNDEDDDEAYSEMKNRKRTLHTSKYDSEDAEWKANLSQKMIKIFLNFHRKRTAATTTNAKKRIRTKTDLRMLSTPTRIRTETNLEKNGFGMVPSYLRLDSLTGNPNVWNPLSNVYLIGSDLAIHGGGFKDEILSSFSPIGDIIGRNLLWDFGRARRRYEEKLNDVLKKEE